MKIAIVCFGSSGGSGVLATELGLRLAKHGHQVHFIAPEMPFRLVGNWKKNVFFHEVEVVWYPVFVSQPYDLALANKIFQVVEQHGIDIIHGHYAVPHFTAILLAKQMAEAKGLKVRTVSTFHGTDVYVMGKDPSIKDVVKYSAENSDCVTTVSRSLANDIHETYGITKDVKVIHNFVTIKPERKKSVALREVFAGKNEKLLCHISNFREVKRIPDVIKIFAAVNKKVPSKLLLIGDGPEKNTAYRLAKKFGVLDRVHFLGVQTNVGKLLSACDIFLLPSEKESFGLSALEAMASGVPVIATNVCGIPEVVEHGKTGFLSELGDVADMAANAIKLLEDKEMFATFSKEAIRVASQKFDITQHVKEYEKLFASLSRKK